MKECVYEGAEQIHCCQCFSTEGLEMKALRKNGKLCGHVWMCKNCGGRIASLDAEFVPIYKTATQPVMAA